MKVLLTPHQEKFVGQKMKGGGYLSQDEVIREALRVYELVEQEDNDPQLEAALRHALRSPRRLKPVEIFVRHDAELDAFGYFQYIRETNPEAALRFLEAIDGTVV